MLTPERAEVSYVTALRRHLSMEFHLLAVMKNGIRVYFTFHMRPNGEISDEFYDMRPTSDYTI